ncbi:MULTISPECIES: MarR family winged helix-turn-helix transcriptional regulator [Citricoccus]|uniref:MarR family transcriptional regulator n=1 Tax=Citricoccus muralis TaxID=169134 RepID=A0ABY8H5R8_9MICC|nr:MULTISPECIES: MarR family transcriptional regulator [Citricoccus]WBL19975.1 MarR family transcriptional regulator [Citricoccus sp. NR2]WFP16477.1 MarR family transcriptional regulator [Citricoccus muralis]
MTSPREDPLALENQVCFALSVASRSVIGAYREVLDPLHLTHPQYLVMLALWQSAPMALKDLAAVLRQEPATLSPLLKRLENQGYLTRERSTADERTLIVELTEEGRQLRERALEVPEIMLDRLGLDEEGFVELHRTLTSLLAGLDHAQQLR